MTSSTGTFTLPAAAVAFLAAMLAGRPGAAQGITEWSTETRTSFAFHVPEAALQRLLPEGWTSAPVASGPSRGANLTVTIMERLLVLDGQGKPLGSGTSRYVTIGAPARSARSGETGTMVIGGLSPEGAGAYDVYETTTVDRVEHSARAQGVEHQVVRESWLFATAGGERLEGEIAFRRGTAVRSTAENRIRSARHPDFSRTYRIEQAADVVRSVPGGIDRVESLVFKASGGKLSLLFDGSETLIAVTAVPLYLREISIP